MTREYFSERELGKKTLNTEEINYIVYNGIITTYKKFIKNFCKDFPIFCEDFSNVICGTNESLLYSSIQAEIPSLEVPLKLIDEYDDVDVYATLDFLEYCYENMYDVEDGYYHSYFNHFHLEIKDTKQSREEFRLQVNRILERNGITFYLDSDGKVKRQLPLEMEKIINSINLETSDERLNELIGFSINQIKKPNLNDRIIALEKIWDSFERMKTYYTENKKISLQQLIEEVTKDTDGFYDVLDEEFKTLTKIGNNYQIRHFEKDKIQIKSSKHIDYLFYRMISVINLCVSELK